MGGCTNCKGKSGCNDRKGEMFSVLDETLARLYPTRTWGEVDDEVRFGAGIDERDGQAIAEELAAELKASTFFRAGSPEEYGDFIYVLCLGREPSLVQVRDGEVPLPEELAAAPGARAASPETIREQYLRVCLSSMARVAAVQQVAMELRREPDGGLLLRELPRAGVYDAPLLPRLQRLVAILPAYDITHLDFGEISAPPRGFQPGSYGSLYGGEPHTANYLFYPQPSMTQVAILLSEN